MRGAPKAPPYYILNRRYKLMKFKVITILATFLALPAFAATNNFTTGYDYTTGKYGQDVSTEIEVVPFTFNRTDGAWNLKLTVPYIRVTGNGTVVPGTSGSFSNFSEGSFGRGGSGASTTSTVVNSGLGDVTGSIGYGFFPANSFFEVTAKVKLGTADADKGLGTGQNDYYLQLDGVIGNNTVSPFFTLGYVVTGDTSTTTYKDVPYGSFGFMFKHNKFKSTGISHDYRQATIEGSEDQKQISAFMTWKNPKGWSTTLALSKGLTNASPDLGLSMYFTNRY